MMFWLGVGIGIFVGGVLGMWTMAALGLQKINALELENEALRRQLRIHGLAEEWQRWMG